MACSTSFCQILTSMSIISLHRLPIPMASVINNLLQAIRQAWLDGQNSVQYSHLSGKTMTHFSLWVVTFWSSVVEIRAKACKPWRDACLWLGKQMHATQSQERWKLACEVHGILDILPWNGKKSGLSEIEPIYELWWYLGDEWL